MKYSYLTAALACCSIAVPFSAKPLSAQSLTHVQLLALQQQLRDDGCGVVHATGRMDAPTKSAIKKCASKYNSSADPKALLAAMNIGFGDSANNSSAMGGALGGTIAPSSPTTTTPTTTDTPTTPSSPVPPVTPTTPATPNTPVPPTTTPSPLPAPAPTTPTTPTTPRTPSTPTTPAPTPGTPTPQD